MLAILGLVIMYFAILWQAIQVVYLFRSNRYFNKATKQYNQSLGILNSSTAFRKTNPEWIKNEKAVLKYHPIASIAVSEIYTQAAKRFDAKARLMRIKSAFFKHGFWYYLLGVGVYFIGTGLHL